MMISRPAFKSGYGFTLVELVIAIVITGIVASFVALFVRMPVQGYVDSAERIQLSDVADSALRRLARDLRLALPNSIRVTTSGGKEYIELLLTKTGGRYLAEEDNPTGGNILDFDNGSTTFDVVGPMHTDSQAIAAGDFIVVYNLGPGLSPADAYSCGGACNRAAVQSVAGNTITLTAVSFAGQAALASPSHYFHVVTGPVMYVCDPGAQTLMRYEGYAIAAAQPTDLAAAPLSAVTPALLASDVTACGFSYDNVAGSLSSGRSGMLGLSLTLGTPQSGSGGITLFHQVHVDNTP